MLLDPIKLQMISSLSSFSIKRSQEVLKQAEKKAPKFMAEFKKILADVTEYRSMELLSLLPLLPTPVRRVRKDPYYG